jgi:hypothetical protein
VWAAPARVRPAHAVASRAALSWHRRRAAGDDATRRRDLSCPPVRLAAALLALALALAVGLVQLAGPTTTVQPGRPSQRRPGLPLRRGRESLSPQWSNTSEVANCARRANAHTTRSDRACSRRGLGALGGSGRRSPWPWSAAVAPRLGGPPA